MDDRISKKAVLLVASMAAFMTPYMGSSINIALPSIGHEFAADPILLGWVATAYLLSAATFLVPLGRLADIYGRKRVFTYGIFIYTITSLLSVLAPSVMVLISLRVVQGIGSAMIFGNAVAIITSTFPPGERGRAIGINVSSVYLGLTMGPFLGGILTQHFGWRSIFISNVPMGLIVITALLWKLKGEWGGAKGEKFDTVGAVIYSLALVTTMYGLASLPDRLAWGLTLAGVLGIVAFIRWEMRVRSPVLNVGIFRHNPVFAFSNLAALINYSATYATGFLLSLYLQYLKGFSPQDAGFTLLAMPAVMTICAPVAGRLSDRIQPRIVASSGMALSAVALGLLAFLGQDSPITFVLAGLAILGVGTGVFSSPNTNVVMSSIDKRTYGVGAAMLGTMRNIGMVFSMGIAMFIFSMHLGRVQITPAVYPAFLLSLRTGFAIFAVLCIGGIFASLVHGKVLRDS